MIIVSVCNKHQSLIGYRVQANDCCMLSDIPTVDCCVLMLIVSAMCVTSLGENLGDDLTD